MNREPDTVMPTARRIAHVDDPALIKDSSQHVARAMIPAGDWARHDPFLLMMEDDFGIGAFGMHPHRGIETITYVIEGSLTHTDNRGNSGVLGPGDVQFMTAGSGVIHLEEPPAGERVHLLQLWLNLPAAQKMTTPRYQDLHAVAMPRHSADGVEVIVYSGTSNGVTSPTLNHVPVTVVEMRLTAGATLTQDLPGSYNGFVHILGGNGEFGATRTTGRAGQTLWLDRPTSGNDTELSVTAVTDLRVLLGAGEPLHEPVVAGGPFVMNTEAQIRQAFLDYRAGRFDPR
ncbi:MAG: pirin family protein [Rhodococcus sp. (in: high G+C Gram-positive bacteria)]|nr:MAG: pirin family protein [Rhodococcus sp. (in: high G+C Gram-positive bacteria)]